MKVITVDVPYESYDDIIKLKIIQDTHIGSPLFDKTGLKNYLSDVDDKTYIIGNGDIFDAIIASDIKRFKKLVDDCETDSPIDEQVNRAKHLLKEYANKIILMGDGNHEDTIIKQCGTSMVRRLCEALSTEEHTIHHAGMKWMLRLNLSKNGGGGRSIVVYGCHGYGGGARTEGGNLTKFSRDMMYDDADIYLFGHVHEQLYKNVPRGYHGGSKYMSKDRLLIIAGCFKKNLTDNDYTTWEESKGFPIRKIGGVTIKIKPTRDWVSMKMEG